MTDDASFFDDLGDRQCHRCGLIKPLQEFAASLRKNGSVKFGSYCPPCRKAYQHEWYLANREKCLAAAAARRQAERTHRPAPPLPPERRPLREAIGFRKFTNPRKQGNAGLGIAIAYLSRIGVDVAIPLTDTQRYDLIAVHNEGMDRVQVKTTTTKDHGSYVVHLRTVGGNKSQVKVRLFDPADYEWLFVVCGDSTAYMIPTTEIRARYSLTLSRRYERFRLED
jgi:hypothetical protein